MQEFPWRRGASCGLLELRQWPQHPLHAQARLFRMFQRLTATYEGTGIGLAIVHRIVERMGGRVGAESAPGKGS